MQLTGIRVALRMRGVAARQRSVEVARADRVEFVGELDVGDAGFDQREGLSGMPDHVGVRTDTGQPEVTGRRLLAERLRGLRTTHPSVAVPLGLAVADADAVHHAVADEPVIERGIDLADRVRAVAQVPAVEIVRNRPDHLEVGQRVLTVDRRELALEVAVRHRDTPYNSVMD